MAAILAFGLSPIGRWLAAFAGVALIITMFGAQQRSKGEADALAGLERKDNVAADKIKKADAASRKPPAGRLRRPVRDPNTVSE